MTARTELSGDESFVVTTPQGSAQIPVRQFGVARVLDPGGPERDLRLTTPRGEQVIVLRQEGSTVALDQLGLTWKCAEDGTVRLFDQAGIEVLRFDGAGLVTVNQSSANFSAEQMAGFVSEAVGRTQGLDSVMVTTAAGMLPGDLLSFMYGQSLSAGAEGWGPFPTYGRAELVMLGGSVFGRDLGDPKPGGGTVAENEWVPINDPATYGQLRSTNLNITPVPAALRSDGTLATWTVPVQTGPDFQGQAGTVPGEAALLTLMFDWLRRQQLGTDTARRWALASCGQGGQPVAALQKGASPNYFGRLTSAASAMAAATTAAARTVRQGPLFINHGQNDSTLNTTQAAFVSGWRTILNDFHSDVTVGIVNAAPELRAPVLMNVAVPTSAATTLMGPQNGALQLGDESEWIGVVGPDYPYADRNNLHMTMGGYLHMGCQYGKVLSRISLHRRRWRPCSPWRCVWRGNEVLVLCHVPVPPLVFDGPLFSTAAETDLAKLDHNAFPTKGFEILVNGVAQSPTSVSIIGGVLVKLTAAAPLSGTIEVRFGGWATNGNGFVRDSDPTVAPLAYTDRTEFQTALTAAGLWGNPYPLHNWLVNFRMAAEAA